MFFALLVGHAIADFPLQAGPMATEKSRHSNSDLQKSVPWYYWLTAHSLVHGGAVYFLTGSLFLGIMETIVHWLIDLAKNEGYTTIHLDQLLHVLCKVVWCGLIALAVPATVDPFLTRLMQLF